MRLSWRLSRSLATALAVCLAAAYGGACEAGEQESAARAAPTAAELPAMVETSAAALVEQESFHFEFEDLEGATLVSPELALAWARGDVQPPVAVRGYLGLSAVGAPGAPLQTEIRVIDGQAFATNPLSGTWTRAEASQLPLRLDGLPETIRTLMTGVGSLEYVGTRRTEAGESDVVRGTIQASAFRVLFAGALEDPEAIVVVETAIAQSDGLPRTIVIDGPLLHTDGNEARRLLTLSEYGEADEFGVPEGF